MPRFIGYNTNTMKNPSSPFAAFLAAAFVCLSAGVSQAADVAFYSFTEGNDGDNAIGVALKNAVDASVLGGSAFRNKGTDATAKFMDDVPGRYLYTNSIWMADAIYRSDVYRSIQTSWITNANAAVDSGTSVNFSDLGARLAALQAWTVEFFFKFDALLMTKAGAYDTYKTNVSFGDDEKLAMCLQNKLISGMLPGIRTYCGGVLARSSGAELSNNGANGKAILPGLWHHVAVTYNRSTRTFKTTLDYTHASGANTCTNESLFATAAFLLGNYCSATRFAALRVTDRVLAANEFMRATSMPPYSTFPETRFHWSFESNTTGDSLGIVQNVAPWRALAGGDDSSQYAYAVDGQMFTPSGDGVVTPLTFAYSDPEIGTRTIDCYAASVTDRAQSFLEYPNGDMRANKACAFTEAGPKNVATETFGKGPTFRMNDLALLTSSDFTVETYWMPDRDGWLAMLDGDAGNRYRTSIFGVKGSFKNDVVNRISCSAAWNLNFNMNSENFNFSCIMAHADGTYSEYSDWNLMGNDYKAKCKDGRMHHYAVVYRVSDSGNDGGPTVRFYIDGTEAKCLKPSYPMVDFGACFQSVAFALGAQELNNHPMQGWFDEVRYTARALSPSEFLRLRSPVGTSILFR